MAEAPQRNSVADQYSARAEQYSSVYEHLLGLQVKRSQIRLIKRALSDSDETTLETACSIAGVQDELLAEAWSRVLTTKLESSPDGGKVRIRYLAFKDLFRIDGSRKSKHMALITDPFGPLSVYFTPEKQEQSFPVILLTSGEQFDKPIVKSMLTHHSAILVVSVRSIKTVYYRAVKPPIDEFWTNLKAIESTDQANRPVEDEEDSSVERAIVALLRHAAYTGASDIQMIGAGKIGVIKLRLDGVYQTLRYLPVTIFMRLIGRLKTLTAVLEQTIAKDVLVEGSFLSGGAQVKSLADLGDSFLFRPQIGKGASGSTATIRILDRGGTVSSFDRIGFDKADAEYLRGLMDLSSGLVAVTGPTGSGKTTTMNSMASLVDPEGRSVQTIEFPVEYIDLRRLQYEVPNNVTDANGARVEESVVATSMLKGLLRNDPDVIVVGEVRDSGMAHLLLRAATTGHLVLSTLHTDDSPGALATLRNFGLATEDIAGQLRAIIALRLVRNLCNYCRVPVNDERVESLFRSKVYEHYRPWMSWYEKKGSVASLYESSAEGCHHCNNAGYVGRRLIYEILRCDEVVKRMLRTNAITADIGSKALDRASTMNARALDLAFSGATSLEEVRNNVPFTPAPDEQAEALA